MRFKDDEYHDSPIIKETQLEFKEISIVPRVVISQIEEQIIVREDNSFMALNGLTEKEDTIFSI